MTGADVATRAPYPARRPALALCRTATAVGLLLQISYPLLDGGGRDPALHTVTVATVVALATAALAHAAAVLPPRGAPVLFLVAGGVGLAAEAIGVRTGLPFGSYTYADTLGPDLLGVPVVVPLAWVMMSYPALVLGRRCAGPVGSAGPRRRSLPGVAAPAAVVAIGAWTLTAWDLLLDPQMVAAGHWTFADPAPGLPGTHGVPLTNLAGWLLVSVVLMTALQLALPTPRHRAGPLSPDERRRGARDEAPVAVLLAWTWAGSVLANAVFFARPGVAGWGFLALGLPVVGYLARLRRDARGAWKIRSTGADGSSTITAAGRSRVEP